MEATSIYRSYKKGVSSPTNTAMHYCYACRKIYNSHTSGETKTSCRGCSFPCNVSNSTLGHEKSRENCCLVGPVKKIGTKLFKHDNSNKNGNLIGCSSSSSFPSVIGFPSSLPTRYNKRAVLCGVSYTKRKFRLKGTINDTSNMRDLLIKNFQFPNECIRVLTEEEQNTKLIPTKQNILESLRWLVKDCEAGDSLVFYFSGHGLQQPDLKEDEIDGLDETLCPVDFIKEGMIVDNDINSTLVWPLKKGVTLHAIVDACHSGTILDLLHVYNYQRGIWEDNKPPCREPIRKHTSGGLAICLSACDDSQVAVDSAVFGGKGMNGVLTYLFTKTIREYPGGITYKGLLGKMHDEIKKINRSRYCNNRILQRIFHRKYIAQDPLLSSSEKFDVSTTIFTL